jgi:hypothetical protein
MTEISANHRSKPLADVFSILVQARASFGRIFFSVAATRLPAVFHPGT